MFTLFITWNNICCICALISLLACLLCEGSQSSNRLATLSIDSPNPFEILYSDSMTFKVAITTTDANLLNKMDICVVVGSFDLNNTIAKPFPQLLQPKRMKLDICAKQNEFKLNGYQPGSQQIIMYLRAMINNQYYMLDLTYEMLELVFIPNNSAAPNALQMSSHYDLLDTITTYWSPDNLSTSQITTPLTKVIGMPTHNLRAASYLNPVRIVIYLKEIQQHGANNRFLHWLFDHSTFNAHNYHLTVVTGSDNNTHNLVLFDQLVSIVQVTVLQFDCLSPGHDLSNTNNTISDSIGALSAYLRSSEVDVVIAVNTLGEELTNCVFHCANNDLSEQPSLTLTANRKPLIIMELANRIVVPEWKDLIDCFIAPSRFVGWHKDIVELGKITTVIYPPAITHDWLTESPCGESFRSELTSSNADVQSGGGGLQHHYNEVSSALFKNDLDRYSHQHNTHSTLKHTVNKLITRNDTQYKYIFVGRLDSEKCPGLLLHTIAYIHSALHTPSVLSELGITVEEVQDFMNKLVLNVYGDGPLRHSLIQLASHLNITLSVHFHGAVNSSQVKHVMLNSDVLVNPKLVGETFGFIHLEANVLGLPVIAFRAGANSETVSGGVLIDPEGGKIIEQLAQALLLMFKQRSEPTLSRENICIQVRSRVAQWNVRRHSHSLMDAVGTALRLKQQS